MKKTIIRIALMATFAIPAAHAGEWGNNFGASSMTSYLNEWNSIQGSLRELDDPTYGTSSYDTTMNKEAFANDLNNQLNELYNSTRFWNN